MYFHFPLYLNLSINVIHLPLYSSSFKGLFVLCFFFKLMLFMNNDDSRFVNLEENWNNR